jgi:putative heme transporter
VEASELERANRERVRVPADLREPSSAQPIRSELRDASSRPRATTAEEMPRVRVTRRQAFLFGAFVLSAVAFLYLVLPQLAGLGSTVHRIEGGEKWWIAIGVVLEMLSFAGYVVLFRAVFVRGPGRGRIEWRVSYEVTMASLAATRLLAAAGAGGIALTVWALRRSGMEPRMVACRMVAFMVLLYVIYAASLLLDGVGLGIGLFPGGGSFAITIVPATVAALLFAGAGAMALLPGDIERRLERWAAGSGRVAHWIARAVTVPALAASGIRTAIGLVRSRDPGLLGAPAWWGFDICVLWASFHAFGAAPPFTVIWMAYFVGMLGNLLPLPGGLGGVEGGMIGAFAVFGVNIDLAVLAVLTYRGISFWLPTIPGAIAYFQLLRTVNRWGDRGATDAGEVDAIPVS